MLIVFSRPPAITEAQKQVHNQKAKRVIFAGVAKNLAMPQIVTEESELSASEGKKTGDRKHDPRTTEQQTKKTNSEKAEGNKKLMQIIPSLWRKKTQALKLVPQTPASGCLSTLSIAHACRQRDTGIALRKHGV